MPGKSIDDKTIWTTNKTIDPFGDRWEHHPDSVDSRLKDEARSSSASGDRVDRERQEQRIRDIVSGAIQPKDADEEREFNTVISAAAG